MDHQLLYKINSSVLTTKNCKRKAANEIRATKRSELYSSTRNISLSPSNGHQNLVEEQKENFKPPFDAAPLKINEPINKKEPEELASQPPPKISEKQSRQRAHLMKFLAWKAEKSKQAKLNENSSKRAPFVVPTGAAVAMVPRTLKKSFAPKNHGFKPPKNLKDLTVEIVGSNSIRCVNGAQQATYHFVETPKKKCNFESKTSSVKSIRAITMPAPKSMPGPIVHKTPIPVQKPPSTTALQKPRDPVGSTRKILASVSKQTPITRTTPKLAPPPQAILKSTIKLETKPNKQIIRSKMPPPLKLPPKPQSNLQLKMPPPSQQPPRIVRKTQTTTAVTRSTSTKLGNSKTGLPALKRPVFKASKKANSSISNALLTTNGNTRSKTSGVPPTFKSNAQSLMQSMVKTSQMVEPIPETPTDVNLANSYINFVTSTKRKSSSSKDSTADLLFTELGNTISPVDDCPTPVEQKSKPKNEQIFNFIRYSIVDSDKENTVKTKVSVGPGQETNMSPEKTSAPPTNYMSPYVSVSRGKVNSKIEREKRSSIYMAADNSAAPETTAAVRHTIATVNYCRKQLMDEIVRLNNQCQVWEQYKEANTQLIGDGVDMIDVTTGQTKLLTSKKLKQFGGLIDRCEEGVLGKNSTGVGEAATPILAEDLEGFWSMVSLQIENVDKRFAELERWRANNWSDPDDVPKKTTNGITNNKRTGKRKPVTTTARPNTALQKMLRNAHAAYLNKKALGADDDVILTPSKSRHVLIRDRRSRSAAATVITVNTPRIIRKSAAFESMPSTDLNETPKLHQHKTQYRLVENAVLNEQNKVPATDCVSPVRPAMSRKSILKTPGSVCRRKSVVFNSPALKFTIEDTVDEGKYISNEDQEEDQRTYKLRNRRIYLRDASEIIIPK